MKLISGLFLTLITSNAMAEMNLKETLLKAAQDKKNQEQAMELAKKGMEHFKGGKKAEQVAEAKPEVKKVEAVKAAKKKSKK